MRKQKIGSTYKIRFCQCSIRLFVALKYAFFILNTNYLAPILKMWFYHPFKLLFYVNVMLPNIEKDFSLTMWQVITGYLLAGSIIGPGGFNFVSEMVQVRCFFLKLNFNFWYSSLPLLKLLLMICLVFIVYETSQLVLKHFWQRQFRSWTFIFHHPLFFFQ